MARRMQKSSRKSRNSITPPPQQFCPAVSVIIPMYNAEKYIGECLDSVLAQTFKNFEVIVVDDCSTDSSPMIVESYKEKFGGRLTFVKRKKNFGGAAMSRNMGINLACGEYIQLLDNDDFLTKTALEELYTLAKDYDADVVYTASRYSYNNGQIRFDKSESFTDKPTLEIDASESLMERFLARRIYIFWTPWLKFVRKKFLVENEIEFPATCSHEDFIWTIELLCCAKRFVNIPNAVYCWRENRGSITRSRRNSMEDLKFWVSIITRIMKRLDGLWHRYEILKRHPDWLYRAHNYIVDECFMNYSFNARSQVPPIAIYDALCSDFANGDKNLSGSYIPFLYSHLDFLQKQMIMNQQKFNEFAAQAQKRIAELEAQLKTK